jgi:ParB family chromosome partitioning protein
MRSGGGLSGFVEELEISRLRPPTHVLRNDLGSLEELMASIYQMGLLQPLIVRPVGGHFEVVAGHRRLEACKRLDIRKVPCHILELSDKEAFEASLVENVQHNTLNPMEEAEAFQKYVRSNGYGSVAELSKRIGKSHSYISRRIALLSLPAGVKGDIVRGRTSPSVAQELLSLSNSDREQVAKLVLEKDVTRSEVRSVVRRVRSSHSRETGDPFQAPASDKDRQRMDRAIGKCIVAARMNLMRFDEVLESLDEYDWILHEYLLEHRNRIHEQIDNLMKLRRKFDEAYEGSGHL